MYLPYSLLEKCRQKLRARFDEILLLFNFLWMIYISVWFSKPVCNWASFSDEHTFCKLQMEPQKRSVYLLAANQHCHISKNSMYIQIEIAGSFAELCTLLRCARGCAVDCRTCNREVAGSNLRRGYFTPRFTQPSIPPRSVNEYQLRLGRQRQVWLIPIADERVGVQVKL